MDGRRELDWMEELAAAHPTQTFRVGIRVNFDLEKMCPGQTTMGEAGGRFGFSYENGTFAAVLERVQRIPNVEVTGLHLHSSSKSRSVAVFEAIASMACKLSGIFPEPAYVDLGAVIAAVWKGVRSIRIIFRLWRRFYKKNLRQKKQC